MSPIIMARLIAALGALGVVATTIASARGLVLTTHEPSAMVVHAGTGLVACLLVLFAQAWFALFFALGLRAPGPASGASANQRQGLRRLALVMAGTAAISVMLTAIAFVSGLLAYTRDATPALHGGLAFAAIAIQAAALWTGLRVVTKAEVVLRAIERGA